MDLPQKRRSSSSQTSVKKHIKPNDHQKKSLNHLSHNIFQQIFDYLGTQDLLLSLSQVSKAFLKNVQSSLSHRSNLSFNLNSISESLQKSQLKESQFLQYISSKSLRKLELSLCRVFKCEGKNKRLERLLRVLKNAKNFELVESFKLNIRNFDAVDIEELFEGFRELRVLKLSTNLYFPRMVRFFLEKFLGTNGSVRRLSLKYLGIEGNDCVCKLLGVLRTPKLTHFTLKFTKSFIIPVFLNNIELSNTLVCLHLPPEFFLTHETAEVVCKFLIDNDSLQILSISATISKSLQYLVRALSCNKTLKCLKLLSCKSNLNPENELNSIDCVEILKAVSKSNLEQLSFCTYFFINTFLHFGMNKESILLNKFLAFTSVLKEMTEHSRKLKKLSITLELVPFYITTRFCRILLNCVKAGKITHLFGYNIAGLLNGSIKTLEIQKKHSTLASNSKEFKMISYIFKLILPHAKSLELVMDSKVFYVEICVKDFIERIKRKGEMLIDVSNCEIVNVILILLAEGIEGCKVYLGSEKEVLGNNFYQIFRALDAKSQVFARYLKKN